jgi:hypothetical protein
MRRISLVASLVIAAMALTSSAAVASPGSAAHRSVLRTATVRTPFTFTANVSGYYGEVSCTGTRTVNKKYPTGKDVETCEAVSGKLAHMVAGKGQTEFENTEGGKVNGWDSDYDGKETHNFTYSVSKNLKKFKIVAIY